MPSDSAQARPLELQALIHPKEQIYFGICVVVSLAVYIFLASAILSGGPAAGALILYLMLGIGGYFVIHGLFFGHIRGNAVRVSSRQFPELNAMADSHARRLSTVYMRQREMETGFFVTFAEILFVPPESPETCSRTRRRTPTDTDAPRQ